MYFVWVFLSCFRPEGSWQQNLYLCLTLLFFFSKRFIYLKYLFIYWLCQVLVVVCGI